MTANSSNIPFTEGRQAFHDGESRDANPYRSSSPGFYRWFAGWDEADQADRMDLIKMAKVDDLRKD